MVKKLNYKTFKKKNNKYKNENEFKKDKNENKMKKNEESNQIIKNIDNLNGKHIRLQNEELSNEKLITIPTKKTIEFNVNNNKTNKRNIEVQKINDEETSIGLIRKFKQVIREANMKNIASFILEEYTGTNLMNKLFEIFSLNKIKIIYHSLMTLYNFYCNKNKAIASAVLMCISLMHN